MSIVGEENYNLRRIEILEKILNRENDSKMSPQKLILNRKFSGSINTHVERKSFLHGKRVSDENFIFGKFIFTYVS